MNLLDLVPEARAQSETDRVLALPRGLPTGPEAAAYAETFRLPGGTRIPNPAQADALWSIHQHGGFVGVLGVGAGKSLIAWLAGRAAGARRVVIMLRASDVRSFEREVAINRLHFDPGPCSIELLPYSMLSHPNHRDRLDELEPDLIVLDEAQNVIGNSARTRRFERYVEAHPETRIIAMSGTLFKNSVADAAGLSAMALKEGSPLPRPGAHLDTWTHVLDPKGMGTADEYAWFDRVVRSMGTGQRDSKVETARAAAHLRFVGTPGVVFTATNSTDAPLTIQKVELALPSRLAELIDTVKRDKTTPDGEDLVASDMHAAVVSRMLALGFYTRWAWEQIPGGRDEEWLIRRGAWRRSLAKELEHHQGSDYDSEKLIRDEVLRQAMVDPRLVDRSTLHFNRWRWAEVEHRPEPPTVPVWVDEFAVDHVVKAYGDQPVIVWYSHRGIEDALRRRGVEVWGSGTDGGALEAGPARFLAASIQVHGTGRNLQAWNRAVVLEVPSDGLIWEQLLGRLHRQGQQAAVQYDVILTHDVVRTALRNAIDNAKFIQAMQGTPQRLLNATWT